MSSDVLTAALRRQLTSLPTRPGIYQFTDQRGVLLYIGKAKDLKKRVSSYFINKTNEQKNPPSPPVGGYGEASNKTNELVNRIVNVEVITTNTEVEALLLEASLIKKNQPPFNIDLKSGSGRYAYLKITDEKFPRILTARHEGDLPHLPRRQTGRQAGKADGKIFGPYTSGQTRREAQYLANTTFKLRTCNTLPKRACLLYHIGLCSAPCIGKIGKEDYADSVSKAAQFLKGDIKELQTKLQGEMQGFSADLKYEQARVRRDQLRAIERIREKQVVDLPKGYDQDVMAAVVTSDETIVQVFNVTKGLISGQKEFRFAGGDFSEFIRRYYDSHVIPEEVVIGEDIEDREVLAAYLSTLKSGKVIVTLPKQGSKKDLVALLKQNLAQSAKVGNAVLYELQQSLNLPTLPNIIEMFDISHTGGTEIVASMVRFVNAQADKSGYRKFKMKTVTDNDDFASMREVVGRRYRRLLEEDKPLPDLIIVDGGRGQLSAALGVLHDLGITTPLVALAKREEEVYTVGRRFPVKLANTSEALKLLQRIRDEAHRFAITFHRQRRSKKLLT